MYPISRLWYDKDSYAHTFDRIDPAALSRDQLYAITGYQRYANVLYNTCTNFVQTSDYMCTYYISAKNDNLLNVRRHLLIMNIDSLKQYDITRVFMW